VADSLSQVAGELYGLPPAEFTAARDDRAGQARAAGDREAAAQIRKLTRPTLSAWLVNQLVRASGPLMSRLFELGQSLHDAQRQLDGDRLRELAVERRQVIAELMPEASRVAAAAGVAVSGSALDEVRATLEAALADADARAAVSAGQLTRPISYAGLGEVDLTSALVAMRPGQAVRPGQAGRPGQPGPGQAGRRPPASRARSGPKPEGDEAGPAAEAAEQDRLIADVEAAEQAAESAARDLAAAESRSLSLVEQRQFLGRRVAHLQAELERAETEDRELAKAVREAKRGQEAAAKVLARAQRALAQARVRAESG
jgi:hypothetical protein